MAEELQMHGSKDEHDSTALISGLRRLKKIRDEEGKHLKKERQDEELWRVRKEQIKGEEILLEQRTITEEKRCGEKGKSRKTKSGRKSRKT